MGQRRVLVSGATGYIGAHLCRHLEAAGHAVSALARPGSDTARLTALAPRVRIARAADSAAEVAAAVQDAAPEVVFHLAALARVETTSDDLDALIEANLAFSTRLLVATQRVGARFINAGSYSEFDTHGREAPDSLNGATKAAFRHLLDHTRAAHGLPALSLILFDVYGPDDGRGKFLPRLAARAGSAEPLPATPGDQELDFVHVDDVARAFLHAADLLCDARPEPLEPLYCVRSGRRVTLRQVAVLLEQAVGRPLPVAWGARPPRPGQRPRPWDGPILPGWRAEIGLEQGLARCFGPG